MAKGRCGESGCGSQREERLRRGCKLGGSEKDSGAEGLKADTKPGATTTAIAKKKGTSDLKELMKKGRKEAQNAKDNDDVIQIEGV